MDTCVHIKQTGQAKVESSVVEYVLIMCILCSTLAHTKTHQPTDIKHTKRVSHGVAASVLHQLRVLLELYPFVLANHGQPAALLAVPAGRPGRGLGGDPKTRPANVGSPGGGRCQ